MPIAIATPRAFATAIPYISAGIFLGLGAFGLLSPLVGEVDNAPPPLVAGAQYSGVGSDGSVFDLQMLDDKRASLVWRGTAGESESEMTVLQWGATHVRLVDDKAITGESVGGVYCFDVVLNLERAASGSDAEWVGSWSSKGCASTGSVAFREAIPIESESFPPMHIDVLGT